MGTPRTIRERLDEFYRRLAAQPPSRTADDALERIRTTLNEVEDDLSGVPKAAPPPPPNAPDGRMYPPLDDFVARLADGGLLARTRGHEIVIGANGRITIRLTANGAIEFEQSGGD